MSYRQLKEKHNEGKEDHFEDPYEYARHLERTSQKHEANLVRRMMKKEEEKDEN